MHLFSIHVTLSDLKILNMRPRRRTMRCAELFKDAIL
jgi:hypothetical protein